MMANTDEKINEYIEKHWIIYLLSVDPSTWSMSKEYQSNICFLVTMW